MKRVWRHAAVVLGLLVGAGPLPGQAVPDEDRPAGLEAWLDAIDSGLVEVAGSASAGRLAEARSVATRLYLDYFEPIEGYYGPGGPYGADPLSNLILAAESRFHVLMASGATAAKVGSVAATLGDDIERIRAAAEAAGVPLHPDAPMVARATLPQTGSAEARTAEIRAILDEMRTAESAYEAGDAARALAAVEHAYLEGIELLEARLPADRVGHLERLIHLSLRPQISAGAPVDHVGGTFAALRAELLSADADLYDGGSFWFGAVNAFIIILREGLEAVLLVAALLAYLGAVGAERRHHRQIYAGLAIGVVASFATWIAAMTLIPIGGANRELIEGITALVAVGVLLYVANWLFQKTYIHDWKAYLRGQLDHAITAGSSAAMAGLAFAAVYREGFETVLFYQALMFDAGSTAVLAGFLPGLVLIVAIGIGIIRLGLRLPLRKVFGATNAILLFLAFVFLGKGIYNLQEAGVFAPSPLAWAPDHEALRLVFGFYPLAETVLAQALFLAALAGTYLFYRRSIRARATAARSAAAPAADPDRTLTRTRTEPGTA